MVIAIIAILAGMLLPAFGAARETAKQADCTSRLKGLGTALAQYASTYNGAYPADADKATANRCKSLEIFRNNGMDETKMFICPSTDIEPQQDSDTAIEDRYSYAYFSGMTEISNSSHIIFADGWDGKKWNHETPKLAYLNLSFGVTRASGNEWYKEFKGHNGTEEIALSGEDVAKKYLKVKSKTASSDWSTAGGNSDADEDKKEETSNKTENEQQKPA